MLLSLLALGFVLGLRHALDADHIAAMASLATRSPGVRSTLRVAAAWGVGHASILVVFGTILVLLGATIPDQVARWLEAGVGLMLVLLGIDLLRRIRHVEIHAHVHQHDGDVRHAHLHVHEEGRAEHVHSHTSSLVPRALLVGCVHGLAGTAALILLAVPTMQSGARAMAYLVVFGAGTVLGMMLFSLLISVSLTMSLRRVRSMKTALEVVVSAINVVLGAWIAIQSLA